ncbi:MAG: BatA domain-containing protein [Fuerstiella sp.]
MEFLTPLFVAAGAIAAAGPFVLHMLRRAPTSQMSFSIVRFLKPSRPKMTKRSKIEHWPLMLLRMLAVVLIGLAFARPFLREVIPSGVSTEGGDAVTILIDRSASMRRDGIRQAVIDAVNSVVDNLEGADLLSVVTFSNTSQRMVTFETWATSSDSERTVIVDELLESYEPDWMHTATGSAMLQAADDLAQEGRLFKDIDQRRLILVTDFQRGSRLDELKSAGWPDSVSVELKLCEPDETGNVGLAWVEGRDGSRGQVRLMSAGDSSEQKIQIQPFNRDSEPVGKAVDVVIAAGQRRSVNLPAGVVKDADVVGVELLADPHAFDNVIDFPPLANPKVTVAHIGSDVKNDPESMRYYLQRVLDGNPARDVVLTDLKQPDQDLYRPIPAESTFVVATSALPEAMLPSVQKLFDRGGIMLLAADSVSAIESLGQFLPSDIQVTEAEIEDYSMLADIDYQHPLFQAFAEARFADFSSIRFWQSRQVVLNLEERKPGDWNVLAEFDNGMPALIEFPVSEEGRLLILAAGWHPTDSQLALSTRFPPLITRLLALAIPESSTQQMQAIGNVIRPSRLLEDSQWRIQYPDGSRQTASEVQAVLNAQNEGLEVLESDEVIVSLDQPGRYVLTAGEQDALQQMTVIANVAASESKTEALPMGQLQALGIGVTEGSGGDAVLDDAAAAKMKTSELESRQKYWRWMLLAGLACLLAESVWATLLERRQADVAV